MLRWQEGPLGGPSPAGAGRGTSGIGPPGQRSPRTATVRYRKRSTIRLSGPSGQLYEFSAERDLQTVHRSDVPFLLRTGFFESV